MRHPKRIIHRAINGIHHPAVIGGHVAGDALLAEHGNAGQGAGQGLLDEFLAADIQFQLDVVGVAEINALGFVPVGMHDPAGGAGGGDGRRQGGF